MGQYNINKGIGKQVEYKGLTAQYLFIFVAGLLGLFFLYVIMYASGAGQWFCICFTGSLALLHVYYTFRLNGKYGPYGLMKKAAARRIPRRIINRKSISRLLKSSGHAKH